MRLPRYVFTKDIKSSWQVANGVAGFFLAKHVNCPPTQIDTSSFFFYLIIVHISRDIFNLSVWMYGWAGTWPSGCGRWRQLEHRLFGTRPSSARVPLDLELPDRLRAMTFLFFVLFLGDAIHSTPHCCPVSPSASPVPPQCLPSVSPVPVHIPYALCTCFYISSHSDSQIPTLALNRGSGTLGLIQALRELKYPGSITTISQEPDLIIDRTKLSKALKRNPFCFQKYQVNEPSSSGVRMQFVAC